MSLLMDALKKAERAKRGQSIGEGTNADASLSAAREQTAMADKLTLEPLATARVSPGAGTAESPNATATTDLSSQLAALDEAFLAEIEKSTRQPSGGLTITPMDEPRRAASPATARSAPRPEPSPQSAAQNLFATKQPTAAPRNNRFMLGLAGLTALAIIGIGGYFWWQLQPHRSSIPPVTSNAVSPAPTFAMSQPAAAQPGPDVAPTAPMHAANPAAVVEDEEADEEHETTRPLPKAPPVAVAREERLLRPNSAPLRLDPALSRGYAAFARGDLTAARNEYLRAQQNDPNNTDALQGLAAIALREGKPEQAATLYQKIIELNPQDATAATALINLRGQATPADAEDELKSLAAAQPELAAPELALGNLYARQERWPEAQQAYFRAYTAEPDNPDLLYNMAVSLEHLRQPKLAAQYYAQALTAAKNHPAAFDSAQAGVRLRALSP
jgi:tetratricopeptide (TPR) repeat protein